MERSDIRESHTTPAPDFAEFILGRTEGATRGLDPGRNTVYTQLNTDGGPSYPSTPCRP